MYTPDKATEWKPSIRGAVDRGLKWKSSQGERARHDGNRPVLLVFGNTATYLITKQGSV